MTENVVQFEQLTEAATVAGALRVDRDARRIENVVLCGPASKNGYRYSESALSEAVSAKLYDNAAVYLNHASDPDRPNQRDVRDRAATVESARMADGRVRGDLVVMTNAAGDELLNLAESDAVGVGCSHTALARRSEDGREVIAIEQVRSVDVVAFPATTQRLSESEQLTEADEPAGGATVGGSAEDDEEPALTLDAINDAIGSHFEQFRGEFGERFAGIEQRIESLEKGAAMADEQKPETADETPDTAGTQESEKFDAFDAAKLLEESGASVTAARMKAVCNADAADRKEVAESFKAPEPVRESVADEKPKSPITVTEGEGNEQKTRSGFEQVCTPSVN